MQTVQTSVLADQSVAAKVIIKQVHGNEAVNLESKKRMVYPAMTDVRVLVHCDLEANFSKVPDLLAAFEKLNLGSTTAFNCDEQERFLRAFLLPSTPMRALPHAQKTVGLGGAHAKNSHYNGTQLLVGRDGDFKNLALAMALVDKETIENYEWFFRNCVRAGIQFTYSLASDRNAVLIAACRSRDTKHKF